MSCDVHALGCSIPDLITAYTWLKVFSCLIFIKLLVTPLSHRDVIPDVLVTSEFLPVLWSKVTNFCRVPTNKVRLEILYESNLSSFSTISLQLLFLIMFSLWVLFGSSTEY